MAVTKITCPECKTVLRPAKPLPAGKTVKCPECGNRFPATEDAPEVALKKPNKAASEKEPAAADATPKKAAAKKPGDKKAEIPKKAAKKQDDDDDGGGTYTFAGEKEGDAKPEIEYAPDMTVRDPRPAANRALLWPSNMLIRVGGLGFFGWVAWLIILLIPLLTPVDADDGDKTKPAKPVIGLEHGLSAVKDEKDPVAEPKNEALDHSAYYLFGVDFTKLNVLAWYRVLLMLSPIFVCAAYSAVLTYAGVRMQAMEGYAWGWVASIMGLFSPIYAGGFLLSASFLIFLLLLSVIGARGTFIIPVLALMIMMLFGGVLAGVWGIYTMMREEVKAAYEYKPD